MKQLRQIKPGWYLLGALFIYSIVISFAYLNARKPQPTPEPVVSQELEEATSTVADGLWFPIPGAHLPEDDSYLPGSARNYRRGENQGFDFYGNDAGIPIVYGQAVIAASDATVIRADTVYTEPSQADWQALIAKVGTDGANETDLNILRGRQVWLELPDKRILRYAHLSAIDPSIKVGETVYRGQVIAYVGNSGTDDGVAGTNRGARLHFEIWNSNGQYFGQGLGTAATREAAQNLFVGP
ncbi:MAG: M23 family metallopeptidase [Trueperaceae bacterium]|nr:M23 family metallopeptidase [Trueperaceae bacterium]